MFNRMPAKAIAARVIAHPDWPRYRAAQDRSDPPYLWAKAHWIRAAEDLDIKPPWPSREARRRREANR